MIRTWHRAVRVSDVVDSCAGQPLSEFPPTSHGTVSRGVSTSHGVATVAIRARTEAECADREAEQADRKLPAPTPPRSDASFEKIRRDVCYA